MADLPSSRFNGGVWDFAAISSPEGERQHLSEAAGQRFSERSGFAPEVGPASGRLLFADQMASSHPQIEGE